MPIHTSVPIHVFDQESFHEVDKRVTGIAFDIHNEFGRYLKERLYQRELTRRCRDVALEVEPEMQINVCLDDFSKDYFVDHLINRGVIIETKAVSALGSVHKGQTLNYLFLCGLHHGSIFNFRTDRVEHEFVSTSLTHDDRKQFEMITRAWKPFTTRCRQLHDHLLRLLNEWGAYLDPILYQEALTHFLGGKDAVEQEVEVLSGTESIGTQTMRLLEKGIAFSVTTATHHPESVFKHQRRFLEHTALRAIQWINLNHNKIELRTIEKK